MKFGILTDPHLISPDDRHESHRKKRAFFGKAWPSFQESLELLHDQSVDEVIILGDLVDYYTDANRDFALSQLEALEAPWHLTPGNHDFEVPGMEQPEAAFHAREGWADAGIPIENRVIDVDDVRFLLVDSALSKVSNQSTDWLEKSLETNRSCVLCTHVPIDVPPVVEAIKRIDPNRDMTKYVQRGSPELFESTLKGRVDLVLSGHLHFSTQADIEGTIQHILPMAITRVENPIEPGGVTVIDTDDAHSLGLHQIRHQSS